MLWQFIQVIKLGPGEDAVAIWLGIWQLARVRTNGDDDGLGFHALRLTAVGWGSNHVVVAIELS